MIYNVPPRLIPVVFNCESLKGYNKWNTLSCVFRSTAKPLPNPDPVGMSPRLMSTGWRRWPRRLRPLGRTSWKTPSWFMEPSTPGGTPPGVWEGSSGLNYRWCTQLIKYEPVWGCFGMDLKSNVDGFQGGTFPLAWLYPGNIHTVLL